ncbi:MAG TPA: hypothetical protein VHK90_00840 [Thermoanaerobaculia bacterium]|nr:hypothetical protein [Thermoanaerobaculia bacterium]
MSDPKPVTRSFDVGASSFVSGTRFILGRGDWKSALAFANAATTATPSSIAFADVREHVQSIRGDAEAWTSMTYPAVVALANAVYDFGNNKAPVYLKKLGMLLAKLGDDPSNATLLAQVEAIVQVLSRAATDGQAAASEAAAQVAQASSRQEAGERKLATVVTAYAGLYRTSSPSTPLLPPALDASVGAVGDAWRQLAETLDALVQWVRANAKGGKKFEAELSLDAAMVEWKTAAAAADDFRTHAYVAGPSLVAV